MTSDKVKHSPHLPLIACVDGNSHYIKAAWFQLHLRWDGAVYPDRLEDAVKYVSKSANLFPELVEALETCKIKRCGYNGLDRTMEFDEEKVKSILSKAREK